MEGSIIPRGLIVDLITPFRSGGSIDGRGLGKQLDRVIPHVTGVLLAGPHAGGGRQLNPEQRQELLEKAIVVIRGRTPILVWVTQETEEMTKETVLILRKGLEKRKYRGPVFWVDTPLYYHSNRGLPSHYADLCALAEAPFILHNDPEMIKGLAKPLKRNNIRTAILKEIVSLGGVQGLIFSGSLDRAYNYQKASRRQSNFRIYDGEEAHFLDHPSLSGVVSVGSNLAPKAWQAITRSSLNLMGPQNIYPDHHQQIWRLGQYVRDLKDRYEPMPVLLINQVLADMGIIEPACSHDSLDEDLKTLKHQLKSLMSKHGDNPGSSQASG